MSLLPGRQIPLGLEAPRALQDAEPDRGADQDVVPEPADQVEEADGRQTEAGAAAGAPPARPLLRGGRNGVLTSTSPAAARLDIRGDYYTIIHIKLFEHTGNILFKGNLPVVNRPLFHTCPKFLSPLLPCQNQIHTTSLYLVGETPFPSLYTDIIRAWPLHHGVLEKFLGMR